MDITKEEAEERMGRVQSPIGLRRSNLPDDMKGLFAKDSWNHHLFAYGMEYGYILAMHDIMTDADSTAELVEDNEWDS